ncbi:MAG: hypothetical protein AAFN91_00895 [Pseudomonadota bacterium]
MSSMRGLGNILALIFTILGAPPLYSRSIGWVQGYTTNHYGYGFEDVTAFVWGALCAGLIFFISRASVSTMLVMGAIAIATRFL